MTTAAIRKKLMTYIADADDKKVKGLYLLVEDEISSKETFQLSEKDLKMLEQDRTTHLKGKSKSYNWKEAKEIIRGQKSV
jgi:hypothetical protein